MGHLRRAWQFGRLERRWYSRPPRFTYLHAVLRRVGCHAYPHRYTRIYIDPYTHCDRDTFYLPNANLHRYLNSHPGADSDADAHARPRGAYTNRHTYAYSYLNSHRNTLAHNHADGYPYTYSHCIGHCDSDKHTTAR